jgi:hypothetical protein
MASPVMRLKHSLVRFVQWQWSRGITATKVAEFGPFLAAQVFGRSVDHSA